MKYTNCIINGSPIRPEEAITGRWKQPVEVLMLPSLLLAVPFLAALTPFAALGDLYRIAELSRLKRLRRRQRRQYLILVIRSLGHVESESLIKYLTAA